MANKIFGLGVLAATGAIAVFALRKSKKVALPSYLAIASNAPAHVKRQEGLLCDGRADEEEILSILDAGYEARLSEGLFQFSSPVKRSGQPTSIQGGGKQVSQVLQTTPNLPAFEFSTIDGMLLRGMTINTVDGSGSCVELKNVHRSTFEDIHSPGAGFVVWHLRGCILDIFKNVDVTVNYGGVLGGKVGFDTAFLCEPDSGIHINANTWLACILEGGRMGWVFTNQAAQGNNLISGGVAEGQSDYGLDVEGALSFVVEQLHLEAGSAMRFVGCGEGVLTGVRGTSLELISCAGFTVTGGYWPGGIYIDETSANNLVQRSRHDGILNKSLSSDFVDLTPQDIIPRGYGVHYRRDRILNSNLTLESSDGILPDNFGNFNAYGLANIERVGDAWQISKSASPNTYKGLLFVVPPECRGQWISVEALVRGGVGTPYCNAWLSGGYKVFGLPMNNSPDLHKFQGRFLFPTTESSMLILFQPGYTEADASFSILSADIRSEF